MMKYECEKEKLCLWFGRLEKDKVTKKTQTAIINYVWAKELKKKKKRERERGNSLVVQWLGLGTFTAVAWVQSLVRELRPWKPRGAANKNFKKRERERKHFNL